MKSVALGVIGAALILMLLVALIRVSRQALAGNAPNLGDVDVGTVGFRYCPFISRRAGFAFHNVFSVMRQRGVAPVSGHDVTISSLLFALDFAY